jgi:hypothetical protein
LHSTNVHASAKVKGVAINATVNPKTFTNLAVKGAFKGITGALDLYLDQTTDSAGDKIKNNTTLIHVGGKFRSVQFDVASINNKEAYASDPDSGGNSKFAPLGSMLKAPLTDKFVNVLGLTVALIATPLTLAEAFTFVE